MAQLLLSPPAVPPRLISRSGRSHRSILGCPEGSSPLPTHPPCPKSHRDQPQHPAAGGGTPARAAAPKGAAAEPPQDHPHPWSHPVRYPSEESRGSRGVERHLCEAARSLPTPRNNTKKRQLKAKSSNYIPTEPARDAGHWCLSRQDLPRARCGTGGSSQNPHFQPGKIGGKQEIGKIGGKLGGDSRALGSPRSTAGPEAARERRLQPHVARGRRRWGRTGGEQPVAKRGHRAAIVIG